MADCGVGGLNSFGAGFSASGLATMWDVPFCIIGTSTCAGAGAGAGTGAGAGGGGASVRVMIEGGVQSYL
jgi:hypothetical protein